MLFMPLIVVAGLAIGIGPEKTSTEVEESLDLSGCWTGRLNGLLEARMEHGIIRSQLRRGGELCHIVADHIEDEGGGRLRTKPHDALCLGIYRQKGDCLIICLQDASFGYPSGFRRDTYCSLLILHRVKAAK